MDNRLELHELLCNILGSRNVYFQPPDNCQMKYPAIVYSLDSIDKHYANGGTYFFKKKYSITVIDEDPDCVIVDKIAQLPGCRFDRPYVSNRLNHYVFEMYY